MILPGIEGISASKMRELAMRGDEKNFIRMTTNVLTKLKNQNDEVRKGMGVQKVIKKYEHSRVEKTCRY